MTEKSNEVMAVARTVAQIAARQDHQREREIFESLTVPLCNLVAAIRRPLEERMAAQEQEIARLRARLDAGGDR